MEGIEKGTILKFVKKHGNSKANFDVGAQYEVIKINYWYSEGSPRPRQFTVRDNDGKKKTFGLRSKSWEIADGSDIFNEKQREAMRLFANEMENLIVCAEAGNFTDDQYEADKNAKIDE